MDKRVLMERKRRKRRQMLIRRAVRLAVCAVALVAAGVFLVRGVILPIAGRLRGNDNSAAEGAEEEVLNKTAVSNPDAAVRQPLRGASDLGKVTQLTPGWHEDDQGRWYRNPDGTYFSSGFQEIDGVTYCFDDRGYIETGWVTLGVQDYYFNEDGSYNPDMKRPMLALTFDDGPGQYTETLLDCLEENNAHATFFMLGQNVELYPEIPVRMLELGCEVGNHSWDHSNLYNLSTEDGISQFTMTDNALIEACGQAATVARAPYGNWTEDVVAGVGKPFFMWSLDSLDWSYMDVTMDYNSVMEGDLTDGSIILMHDIHEPSVQTCLKLIPDLIEKGYKLVTVSELAAAKGVSLQSAVYTDFWDSSLTAGKVAGYDPEAVTEFSGNSEEDMDTAEDTGTEDTEPAVEEDTSEDVVADESE